MQGLFNSYAVVIRNRIPAGSDLFRRIAVMLPLFNIMNIGSMSGLFYLFPRICLAACDIKTNMHWWAVLFGCILSTAITFINEGLANREHFHISRSFFVSIRSLDKIDDYFGNRLIPGLRPSDSKEALVGRERVTEFKKWMGK